MIELLAVLTEGGVPVAVKSTMSVGNDALVGALIEAARTLSTILASGTVHRLGFKNKTMIILESKKRYTVVGVVDRAEDYMDSLMQVIADAIDNSVIPPADGVVTEVHQKIVQHVFDRHIRDTVEVSIHTIVSEVWTPILEAIRSSSRLSSIEDEISKLMVRTENKERWMSFKESIGVSKTLAVDYAKHGAFDYACAASMGLEESHVKIFCIKMGALASSMTNIIAPPVCELRRLADELPADDPLTRLAQHLVGLLERTSVPADYSRAFRDALNQFDFVNDESHLMAGLIFIDPRIGEYPTHAKRLREFYETWSSVVTSYIDAILERGRILSKVYSVTEYDQFREDLGIYRGNIPTVLNDLNKWLQNSSKQTTQSEVHITNEWLLKTSLTFQSYFTLLAGVIESPVLTLAERKTVLDEILRLYHDYFRRLINSGTPLFGMTLDSVFQSLSVAQAIYYRLSTGETRERHRKRILTFLSDIYKILAAEWPKTRIRFSIPVITNALSPVLGDSADVTREEIRLILIAMHLIDVDTIDATQITRPEEYATELGNLTTTLTAIASRILDNDARRTAVLRIGIKTALEVHEWFVSHGIVCREDIISTTCHAAMLVDKVSETECDDIVKRIVALNRIVVQDPVKHDYELAVTSTPLMHLLVKAWQRYGKQWYYDDAKKMLDMVNIIWFKYGLQDMAQQLKNKFQVLESTTATQRTS